MKLNRITVDLDISDKYTAIFKLVKALIYAVNKYGRDRVKVYVTPSGRGFRIKIFDVEVDPFTNLLERAVMDDDPYRILYSLKRYAASGNPDELDVEFFWKKYLGQNYEAYVKEVPISEILTEEEFKKLSELYGTDEFQVHLQKIYKEIYKRLAKYLKPVQALYIVISTKDLDEIANALMKARAKFSVFRDPYTHGRTLIVRIIASDEFIRSFLNKYKDKILRYDFINEIKK